jgi:hypothetical protein
MSALEAVGREAGRRDWVPSNVRVHAPSSMVLALVVESRLCERVRCSRGPQSVCGKGVGARGLAPTHAVFQISQQ